MLLTSPEIINNGLFSKKYAVYKVVTHPFKYDVKRRYNDFLWLRMMLVRDFPTLFVMKIYQIPPMADKTQRSLDPDYLYKRASQLQQFLDGVIESEELRASLPLLCFLKCTKDDQWVQIKQELEKSVLKYSVQILKSEFKTLLFKETV